MRSTLMIGAFALTVYASPAPQGFDPNAFDSIPVSVDQGPPVGPGAAQDTNYIQAQAQVTAAAAATGVATAAQAKRNVAVEFEARALATPAPTAIISVPPYNPSSTNIAPSSCTPVSWTNTFAFTSTTACPTAIEVGTYCGFINPLDPCAAQPNSYAADTTPDTVDAFKSNPVYHSLAKSATTPAGYASNFTDLNGSVEGSGYLSYKILTSYDPSACSAYCDETATCTGFNIFIERDPKWNPWKCSCAAPSIAQIKCSIWGQDVKKETATNVGGNQNGFDVVIVASNGYNKKPAAPPTPPNCNKPQDCGKKLHNQAPYCMGEKTFPGPYDPSVCAAYAQKQNDLNRKAGIISFILSLFGFNKGGCVQFQASYLEKAGKGFGTNCRLFTRKFTPAQANLDLSINTSNSWGCQKAYTWDVDVNANFNWASLFTPKQTTNVNADTGIRK